MLKRGTMGERHAPSINASSVAAAWSNDLIDRLLSVVWKAYDELANNTLSNIDMSQDFDDLERELTENLFREIQKVHDSSLSVFPIHAPCERESRSAPPAQPPTYDLAFALHANTRIMWPLEAKVLQSDRNLKTNLGDYTGTFTSRFLTCYYAPFSPSGVMLAYLKSGDPNILLSHLSSNLGTTMTPHPLFQSRAHRTTDHIRSVKPGKPYPARFHGHHLVMPLIVSKKSSSQS